MAGIDLAALLGTVTQGDEKFKRGMDQFVKGWGKFLVQTPIDMWLAGTLGGATLGKIGRMLYSPEKTILQSVFGTAVEYDLIIIKQGYAEFLNAGDNNGLTLTNNTRAITIGNTIYMKEDIPSTPDWNSTLVHETTHVWQHQHGGTDYMSEAAWAQFVGGYGYGDAVTVQNKTWAMLNPEQQGQLIQDAYSAGFFTANVNQWIEVDVRTGAKTFKPDLAKYMQIVVPQLRAGQGAT